MSAGINNVDRGATIDADRGLMMTLASHNQLVTPKLLLLLLRRDLQLTADVAVFGNFLTPPKTFSNRIGSPNQVLTSHDTFSTFFGILP